MKKIQVQGITYEVAIADKSVVEVQVSTQGSNNNEKYYYDTTNKALLPLPDGIVCDEERYKAILVAVQEMRTAE